MGIGVFDSFILFPKEERIFIISLERNKTTPDKCKRYAVSNKAARGFIRIFY